MNRREFVAVGGCVKRREPAEEKGAQLFVVAKVVVLHSL